MKYMEENHQEKHEPDVIYLERREKGFIERMYDDNDNIIYKKFPDQSNPHQYHYDKFNNTTWTKDCNGVEQWHYYNDNGLPIFRKTSWGFKGEWRDYDELNNRIILTKLSKYSCNYKYNEDTNSIDYQNSKGVNKTYYYSDKAELIRVEDRTIKDTYESNAQEILYKIFEYLFGENAYVADSCGGNQANELIYERIMENFPKYNSCNNTKLHEIFADIRRKIYNG